MKTRTTTLLRSPVFPLMLAAGLFMGCRGDDSSTENNMDSASSPATMTTTPGGDASATGTDMDNTGASAATADRYNANGALDPNGNYNADGSLRPGVILTSAQERSDAMAGMNGIRATLMAELNEVRAHLNDGTLDKEHAEADKKRAADLAQGLERMDLTLAAMGDATDATWAQVRTARMKEATDLRTWWNAHLAEREATAQK